MKLSDLRNQGLADRACGWQGAPVLDNYANCKQFKDSANVEFCKVYLTVHGERMDPEQDASGYFDVQSVMCSGQDIFDLLDSKTVQTLADLAYWRLG